MNASLLCPLWLSGSQDSNRVSSAVSEASHSAVSVYGLYSCKEKGTSSLRDVSMKRTCPLPMLSHRELIS